MKRLFLTFAASLLLAPTVVAEKKFVTEIYTRRSNPDQPGLFVMSEVQYEKRNGIEIPGTRRESLLLVDCDNGKEVALDEKGHLQIFQAFGLVADTCKKRGYVRWWND